jgi:hypothetical protein
MTDQDLSKAYYTSTSRVIDLMQNLYDVLHHNNGNPINEKDLVCRLTNEHLKEIRSELDLIKTAVAEAEEVKYK